MGENIFDKDLLTIKEFAEISGMTVEALRHYDRKGVFQPARHGIKYENEYRYYAPTQIMTVKMVRILADIGVPLQTIKELNNSRTPEKLLKLLSKHKDIVTDDMRFLHEVYSVINSFIELLSDGVCATENEIHVAEMPEKQIILGGINDFSDSGSIFREFTRFCLTQHEPKLNLSYPVGGYWESMEVFLDMSAQPSRFFSLDPKGHQRKEAGLYLVAYTRGFYGQTNNLPVRMKAFAKKNGLLFNGPVYNHYLFDELSVNDDSQYLLQASASVKETRRLPSRRSHHYL
jgi:DNA-binding transcriptional MerR regulator